MKLSPIWQIITIGAFSATAAFGVFKWMDKQQDTDVDQLQWQAVQAEWMIDQSVQTSDMQKMIQYNNELVDSLISVTNLNRKAIISNRSTIIKQIESDTGLSGKEAIDLIRGLYEGIDDIKKNTSMQRIEMEWPGWMTLQPDTDLARVK